MSDRVLLERILDRTPNVIKKHPRLIIYSGFITAGAAERAPVKTAVIIGLLEIAYQIERYCRRNFDYSDYKKPTI